MVIYQQEEGILLTREREIKEKYKEGLRLLDDGEYGKAVEHFQKMLQEEPGDPAVLNKLGVAYVYLKEMDKAQEKFKEAITVDNQFSPAYSNLGNIYQEKRDLQQAKAYYQKALTYDPEYGPARNNLGIIYKKEGNLGKAVQEFKKAQKAGSFSVNNSSKGSFLANKGCTIIFVLLFLIIILWVFFY